MRLGVVISLQYIYRIRAVYSMSIITNGLPLLSFHILDETLGSTLYKTWALMQAIAACCSLALLWQAHGDMEGILTVKS